MQRNKTVYNTKPCTNKQIQSVNNIHQFKDTSESDDDTESSSVNVAVNKKEFHQTNAHNALVLQKYTDEIIKTKAEDRILKEEKDKCEELLKEYGNKLKIINDQKEFYKKEIEILKAKDLKHIKKGTMKVEKMEYTLNDSEMEKSIQEYYEKHKPIENDIITQAKKLLNSI